jgi:2'-5' RNA ligase
VRTQRLFFALWPNDSLRDRLYALVPHALERGSGRRVSRENLHVTLVFLGSVDAKTRTCIEQVASALNGESFTLTFDELGYWPKPRVVWVGASCLPEPLRQLVGELNSQLSVCGIEPEKREYRAHMTLARKVKKWINRGQIDPIDWPVSDFVLVESCTQPSGVTYQVLRSWALN